jgi:hypothetical protein
MKQSMTQVTHNDMIMNHSRFRLTTKKQNISR